MKTAASVLATRVLGVLFVLTGGGVTGGGEAVAESFDYRASGTNLTTVIDANGDGTPGAALTAAGDGTLGPFTLAGVNEVVLDLEDPEDPSSVVFCALPDATPGLQFRQILGSLVFRVRSGDLLTAEAVAGTSCLSLASCFDALGQLRAGCVGRVSNLWQVTGGTGRLAGASGSFEQEGSIEILVASPTGSFNSFVAEATGVIDVPLAEDDDDD